VRRVMVSSGLEHLGRLRDETLRELLPSTCNRRGHDQDANPDHRKYRPTVIDADGLPIIGPPLGEVHCPILPASAAGTDDVTACATRSL
jgi:hypothetical protein